MNKKTNAAAGIGSRAANEKACQDSSIRSRTKAAIVWLGSHGVLPFALTDWLIQRGGLRHA